MRERSTESGVGLPDRIVEIGAAIADGAVELGRDVPGLTLHELGVIGPGLDQRGLVLLVEGGKIDEHDRARFETELAVDGKSRVHGLPCICESRRAGRPTMTSRFQTSAAKGRDTAPRAARALDGGALPRERFSPLTQSDTRRRGSSWNSLTVSRLRYRLVVG